MVCGEKACLLPLQSLEQLPADTQWDKERIPCWPHSYSTFCHQALTFFYQIKSLLHSWPPPPRVILCSLKLVVAFVWSSDDFSVQSIGSLQKKYSIGSFELLSKTAPIQACSLLVLGPFCDYYLSGNLLLDYKYTYGAIVSINQSSYSQIMMHIWLVLLRPIQLYALWSWMCVALSAVLYTPVVFISCVLQCESVSLHRAILCSFLPGSRPHEDRVCPDFGLVALWICVDF